MRSPRTCSGRFDVFEFGEEDEHSEVFAKQTLSKFSNHGYDDNGRKRRSSSRLNKCNFLQLSRLGEKKLASIVIDVDNAAVDGCKSEAKRKESSFIVDEVIVDNAAVDGCKSEAKRKESSFIVDEVIVDVDGAGGCKPEAISKESGHNAINLDDDDDYSADVDETGIDKSNFSVYDPSWSEGQQALKSPDGVFSHSESFEGVVFYPKGDPDAVSVSERDMELLQPDRFVNDAIIDFYIKYLQSKIPPEHKHKFHFFNSFFFRKLSDMDKHSSDPHKYEVAFQRVYKWTKNVNLFGKDFIFIPVNYRLHWSLIVICSPGVVVHSRDDGSEGFVMNPCILHMDSIKGSHKDLGDLVRRYLREEWKQRHNDTVDGVSSKFLYLRFAPLELPQQENLSDCGLFLLHYVELFIKEASSSLKSTKQSNFLKRGWFHPKEASMKRPRIQQLISEVLKDQSTNLSGKEASSSFSVSNCRETGLELLTERSHSPEIWHPFFSRSVNELGIQLSPPTVSSQRVPEIREPACISKELFEDGTSASPYSDKKFREVGSFFSPVEVVDEEAGEHVSYLFSDRAGQLQIRTNNSRISHLGEDATSLGRCQIEEVSDDRLSSELSASSSSKSSETRTDEHMHPEFDRSNNGERQESPSSIKNLEVCVVEDSEEENSIGSDDVAEVKESPSCFLNITYATWGSVFGSKRRGCKRTKAHW